MIARNRFVPAGAQPITLRHALAREVFLAVSLVVIACSVLSVAILVPSRIKTDAMRTRRDKLLADRDKLQAALQDVRDRTAALENDPWAIERELRRYRGFLRPNERVLKLGS